MAPLPQQMVEQLRTVSTATLTSQLLKLGFRNTFMRGPRPLRSDLRLVGTAFTLRYVPAREDLDLQGEVDNTRSVQRLAIEAIGPGEVLVIDARGDLGAGTLGDILAARIMVRGATGLVTDGALRDTTGIAALDLPAYCAAGHASASFIRHHAADMNVTIGCGGVLVEPGDVLAGDAAGVVVIPRRLSEEVVAKAYEQERLEEYVMGLVRGGRSIRGVYPPDAETRRAYEKAREADPA